MFKFVIPIKFKASLAFIPNKVAVYITSALKSRIFSIIEISMKYGIFIVRYIKLFMLFVLQQKLLPAPYDDGMCATDRKLEYYTYYTLTNCQRECMIDFVIKECNCCPSVVEVIGNP